MRIASLVRRTLGLKGHRVEKVFEAQGQILVRLAANKRSRPVCSKCGRKMPGYDTLSERRWRHVPLWGIPVTLIFAPRRGRCKKCGVTAEAMPWNRGKCRLSVPLIIVLATFARILPWEEVSRLCSVHWNTVRAAVASAVEYGFEHRDTAEVLAIGVDEISRRKGQVYVTMVYDLSTMRLLWCGDGREVATLRAFFAEWGEERCGAIKAVCMDMLPGYETAVKEKLPHALVVFDKFHIVQQLMRAVDTVRKEEARRLREAGLDVLKNTKYIWLKNPENLNERQRLKLSELEKLNLKVNRAYFLKEGFRRFWDYSVPGYAEMHLDDWLWLVANSRLDPFKDFAKMIKRHRPEIMNYFKTNITNGAVEGMNRKAKVVSQRAYGYRTFGTFQLALYHSLGKMPMPEMTHRFL